MLQKPGGIIALLDEAWSVIFLSFLFLHLYWKLIFILNAIQSWLRVDIYDNYLLFAVSLWHLEAHQQYGQAQICLPTYTTLLLL